MGQRLRKVAAERRVAELHVARQLLQMRRRLERLVGAVRRADEGQIRVLPVEAAAHVEEEVVEGPRRMVVLLFERLALLAVAELAAVVVVEQTEERPPAVVVFALEDDLDVARVLVAEFGVGVAELELGGALAAGAQREEFGVGLEVRLVLEVLERPLDVADFAAVGDLARGDDDLPSMPRDARVEVALFIDAEAAVEVLEVLRRRVEVAGVIDYRGDDRLLEFTDDELRLLGERRPVAGRVDPAAAEHVAQKVVDRVVVAVPPFAVEVDVAADTRDAPFALLERLLVGLGAHADVDVPGLALVGGKVRAGDLLQGAPQVVGGGEFAVGRLRLRDDRVVGFSAVGEHQIGGRDRAAPQRRQTAEEKSEFLHFTFLSALLYVK